MRKIKFLSIFVLASTFVFINSCKKNTKQVDTETQSVVDNSICEQEFMQIQPTTNNLAIKTKGTGAQRLNATTTAACDSLTYVGGDTTYANLASPPTYTFNYGACSLVNIDGVVRTGTVWIRFLGRPRLVNSKTIIKLINYKINGAITYTCDSIVVTNLNPITNPIKSFRVQIINAICTGTGWNIKYHSDKTVNVNTNNTPLILSDDVLTVTGTAGGTNRNNVDFDVVINGITKPASCKYITAGTLDVTPSGLSKRTVDYGTGACDDDATFTVNGQTIAFKLK
ncbi:MAG TPA: hypothetical protein VN026_14545 [Bacteroidia bacterium]|jgi:hypothetical protein|nr:hypothetical protein [Bacteroidia bacterium]